MTQHPPPGTANYMDSRQPAGASPRAGGGNQQPEAMTAEERAAVQRGQADARAGHFATDEEIKAAYRRFRP